MPSAWHKAVRTSANHTRKHQSNRESERRERGKLWELTQFAALTHREPGPPSLQAPPRIVAYQSNPAPAPSVASGQDSGISNLLSDPYYNNTHFPGSFLFPTIYGLNLNALGTLSSVSNLASGTDAQGNPLFSKQDLTDLANRSGRFGSASEQQQLAAQLVLGNQQLETALDQANADGSFDSANEDDWYNFTALNQQADKIAAAGPGSPILGAPNPENPASATAEGAQAEEPPKPEQEQAPASE